MTQSSPESLVDILARFDRVVEVGIGRNTTLAADLAARGVDVTATDVVPLDVPAGVEFVMDDITAPTRGIYEGADAIYAKRLPPELQRPAWDLARSLDIPLYFTTLGGDPAVVPAEPRTIAMGTVFVATRN